MNHAINLLGNSQTFFGVISTIIILSILKVESNFIFEILKNIKDHIITKIQDSKPAVSFDSVKNGSDYKTVLYYQKRDDKDDFLSQQCSKMCAQLEKAKFDFQDKLLNWDEDAKKIAKLIEDKNEQQMAPMFIFAYTIVVFLVDELLRCSQIACNNFILVSFFFFNSFVFLFWLVKWANFLFRDKITPQEHQYKNIYRRMSSTMQFAVYLGIMAIMLLLLKAVATRYNINTAKIELLTIFGLYLIMGIIHIGVQKKRAAGQIYLHYVVHFLFMIILAIVLTTILLFADSEAIVYLDLLDPQKIFYLKIVVFSNALCFGLVFPFFLPFIRYSCLYFDSVIHARYIRFYAWIKRKVIISDFENLANKLPIE